MSRVLALLLGSTLAACTTTGHGRVTHAYDEDQQASVKLGVTGRVEPGQHVEVLTRQCNERYSPVDSTMYCRSVPVGHGVVQSLVDSRTAVVRADPGTTLKPGMFVRAEKQPAH